MLVQVGHRFVSDQSSLDASASFARQMKEVLLQNKFFHDCHEEFVRDLIVNIYRKKYCANRFLIEEGTRGHSMFVLYKGLVEVSANGRVVCRLKGGSVFGEMAMLDISNRRTATVKTLEKCDTAVIFRNTFFHILEKFPWERRKFQREAKRKLLQLGKLLNVKGEDINLAQQAADLDALRTIPFLSDAAFSDDFVSEVALNVSSVYFRPGAMLLHEGDPPGGKLYFMLRGVAEVSRGGTFVARMEHAVIGDVGSGSANAHRSSASVRTVTACHLHALDRADALQILAKFPAERRLLAQYTYRAFLDDKGALPAAEEARDAPHVPRRLLAAGNCLGNPAADAAMMAANAELSAAVEPEFLLALTPYFATRVMSGGIEVVTEGDTTNIDHVFFVQRGEVCVWKRGAYLGTFGPGFFFGEGSVLLPEQVRTASVRTDTVADLRVLTAEAFQMLLRRFPQASAYFRQVAESRAKQGRELVAAQAKTVSPHFEFLFLKSGAPLLERGRLPEEGAELQPGAPLQLGLVLDYDGPGCSNLPGPLPDELFDPVRVDARAPPNEQPPPNHVAGALANYAPHSRPQGEPWA